MATYLLIALGIDVVIVAMGLPLQRVYLRHLRHHHRPFWEEMVRQSPASWRYFRGMPTTGFLISTFIGAPKYRHSESPGHLWLGRWIVFLNVLHGLLIVGIILMLFMMLIGY